MEELAKDQPEDFIFKDRHGHEIGAGVDEDPEAPQNLIDPTEAAINPQQQLQQLEDTAESTGNGENEADELPQQEPALDNDAPAPDIPVPALTAVPHVQLPDTVESAGVPTQPAQPAESAGVRRSTRIRNPTKDYVPSFTGSKYASAVQFLELQEKMGKAIAEMESGEVMHPDAHLSFFQTMCEEEPDVVKAIMTQMSLKAGLKALGKESQESSLRQNEAATFQGHVPPSTLERSNKGTKSPNTRVPSIS